MSTKGLLSIAHLLLIRDASMHNKQSGEKKEQPRTALFLGELKQALGSSPKKKSFIIAMSYVSFLTCTHTPLANEDFSYVQEVLQISMCVYQR